ncbi:MAG TPA: hypothetical protein PLQ93_04780 [Bacteroidia bacterium]|nr:hypothetical protein [Bacteroidia bacterium]
MIRQGFLLILSLGFIPLLSTAQEVPSIKVRKTSNLAKVVLDNTEYRLVVFDRFGNPTEANILHYRLHIQGKRDTREFEGKSNVLSPEMIRYLKALSHSCKLYFTEISVEEEGGHVTVLPDAIEMWFPECKNCEPTKKRSQAPF